MGHTTPWNNRLVSVSDTPWILLVGTSYVRRSTVLDGLFETVDLLGKLLYDDDGNDDGGSDDVPLVGEVVVLRRLVGDGFFSVLPSVWILVFLRIANS